MNIYHQRRLNLKNIMKTGVVLLKGSKQIPLNLPMNLIPMRQSSHVLYLTGIKEPDIVVLYDIEEDNLEIFAHEVSDEDILWHGHVTTFGMLKEISSAQHIYQHSKFEERLTYYKNKYKSIETIPSNDYEWNSKLEKLGIVTEQYGLMDREKENKFADAIIQLRLIHDETSIKSLKLSSNVTSNIFYMAMSSTIAGINESAIRGFFKGSFIANGGRAAYDPIVTTRGDILHCRDSSNSLEHGQLLLVDAGFEEAGGYASDVTRTWPVSGRFSSIQSDIYQIVLETQMACIEKVKAFNEYIDIHMLAVQMISNGLKTLGILKGNIDSIIENDAYSLFFPHGVGHLLGLDVHDIEDLGDRAGYHRLQKRSTREGLKYLRLNRTLQKNMVVTIEPGIYFIDFLLNQTKIQDKYKEWVDFERVFALTGLNKEKNPLRGIRIEDDVLVTDDEPFILTSSIPKSIDELENIIGTSPHTLGGMKAFHPVSI